MSDHIQNQGSNFQSKPEKILIRTPNWLGDLMMSVAFIQHVLRKHPDSTVDLIVKKGFEKIPLPHRGDLLVFEKKTTSLFKFGTFLNARKYDCIFILPPSFSSALMAFIAKIPIRVGYRGHFRSIMLSPSKAYKKKHRSEHIIKEYLDLLEDDVKTELLWPQLELSHDWITEKTTNIKIAQNSICLAPGAIYGPAKQWPVNHFKEIASLLANEGHKVTIVGTQSDFQDGEIIRADSPGVNNLCGKTDLPQLIALLATSRLLISNDSGAMHIMAALQKPQIAIFGSTSSTWTGPMNRNARIVSVNLDCSPCFSRTCPEKHYKCQKNVTPDLVLKQIKDLMDL
ncbi:MAG: lipopolysaccharide heptosyltransferase II [Proteobacteria bacterium]|nr:lipopolysaccharide heptosyltransferase II [Pseudomonadota bacterium]